MINLLRDITRQLQWLKPIAILMVFLSSGLCVYILLATSGIAKDDYYLLPSAVILLWAIMLNIFLYGFPHAPEAVNQSHGFFRRIKIRIQRLFYFVLALICLVLTAAVAFYTYKFLSIWLTTQA